MDLNNTASLFYTLGLENIREITERKNIMLSLTQEKAEENIIPNVDIIPSSLSLCNIRANRLSCLKKNVLINLIMITLSLILLQLMTT